MSRYFDPTSLSAPPKVDPLTELDSSLSCIIKNFPPKSHYHRRELAGFYDGPTSIAFLFFHISVVKPDLEIEGHKAREWTRRYLEHDIAGEEDVDAGQYASYSVATTSV